MKNLQTILFLLTALNINLAYAFSASEPAPYTIKLDGAFEESFYDATADEDGNLYMVGAYTSTTDARITVYRDTTADDQQRQLTQTWDLPSSNGDSDLVIVKVNSLGNIDWVIPIGGTGKDAATGAVFDRINNKLFVTGYISGEFDIYPNYSATTASGIDTTTTTNLFVAAINIEFGNIEHFESMPLHAAGTTDTLTDINITTGDDRPESVMQLQGQSVALAYDVTSSADFAVSLYIKGQMHPITQTNAQLGIHAGTTYDVTDQSGHWAFVSKVVYRDMPAAQNGETRWTWEWMSPVSSQRDANHASVVTQLTVDPQQGRASPVYVSGYWSGNMAAGIQSARSSEGESSGYVAALQASNGQTNYMASIGGDSMVNAVVTDDNGDLIIAGNVARLDENSSDVLLKPANIVSGTTLTVTPDWSVYPKSSPRFKHRAFVAKLNKFGDWRWATLMGGRYSSALDLQKSSDGAFYLSGGLGKDTTFNGLNQDLSALSLGELSVNNEITSITLPQQLADYAVAPTGASTSRDLFIQEWYDATLSCPANTELLNGFCYSQCNTNYVANGDLCVQQADSYASGSNTSCPADFDLIGSYCYDTCEPDEPLVWDTTQCWDGVEAFERYYECPGEESNGTCYPTCNTGYTRSGNNCILNADQYSRPKTPATAGCMSTNNCSISLADSAITIELLRNGNVFSSTVIDNKERGKADYNSAIYLELMDYLDTALTPNPKQIDDISVGNDDYSHLIWNDLWQLRFVHNGTTSEANYHLSNDLLISFNLADDRVNTTSVISNFDVNNASGSITLDLGVGLDFIDFVEPELVPDSFAYIARFRDTGIAAEFDWLEHSANQDTHSSLMVLSPLQTLYMFGGRGHYPRLSAQLDEIEPYATRDNSGADNLASRGTILNVINPDNGEFLPDFLRYFDYIVGDQIYPPIGGLNSGAIIPRRTIPEHMLIDNPTLDGTPHNKKLLSAPSNSGVYAVAPQNHSFVLWPTETSAQALYQPLIGKAIRVRWPTIDEGLQEYVYSTDNEITLPSHLMNPDTASNMFHWIHYAETVTSEVINGQTIAPGTPVDTGIWYSEATPPAGSDTVQLGLQLNTSADRMASLIFFDSIDFNQGAPTIVAVRSYDWAQQLTQNQATEIGQTISSPPIASPSNQAYVMTERPRYDTVIHTRAERDGQIIPVNQNGSEISETLYLTWYQSDAFGRHWPRAPVHYIPDWPASADKIVIASQKGSNTPLDNGNAPSLDGLHATQNQPTLYVQNDRSQPGFNPNEEHALPYQPSGSDYVQFYALREDLNNTPQGKLTSDPFVLVRYTDPDEQLWKYRVWQVQAFNTQYPTFNLNPAKAGEQVVAPFPLNVRPGLASLQTNGSGEGFWLDKDGQVWARSDAPFNVNYFYRMQSDFWNDLDGDDIQDVDTGDVAWPKTESGNAVTLTYSSEWPDELEIPTLAIGESLLDARNGLPDLRNMQSLKVVFDQNDPVNLDTSSATRATDATVRLLDFSAVVTEALPNNVDMTNFDGTSLTLIDDASNVLFTLPARVDTNTGHYSFPTLPSDLRYRLLFNPYLGNLGQFYFQGGDFDATTAQPASGSSAVMTLTSIMTEKEKSVLKLLDNSDGFSNLIDESSTAWDGIVESLFRKSRNPQDIDLDNSNGPDDTLLVGFEKNGSGLLHKAVEGTPLLSSAFAQQEGYVVLAANVDYDPNNTSPVEMYVIKVVNPKSNGNLHVIRNADNALDQRLVVRQALDFGGRADELEFDWWWHPDVEGEPEVIIGTDGTPEGNQWQRLDMASGLNALTLSSGLPVLADGWVISRYRGLLDNSWSEFSGQANVNPGDIRPVYTSGWVRRVLEGINSFEQRYSNFHDTEADSYTSMLVQAGKRYEGDIALSTENGNLNSVGLIELYQTVLNRAIDLSIEANNPITNEIAVNKQLLLAASRIADMYLLLGNEAFSDAMDPTVGIQTSDGSTGYLAPTLFAFSEQLPSLLDEELSLLRGVDHRDTTPVYNRLPWNFSSGTEGEPTYVQVYGISDTNGNGALDDAQSLYPQGHGDAWGHYLTATKQYYALARHSNYDWQPVTDTTQIGDLFVQVDYKDEQRFARAAAAKARTGARIVDLTFRDQYTHAPSGQWQGYKDSNPDRAWGMDGWARRTAQAAVLDWALGNALLPYEDTGSNNGVEKIDRQTVVELSALPAALAEVDAVVSQADRGNNPFGLAGDAIPFDIDPVALAAGETHFDQIYQRALDATTNTLALFDYANDLSQQLRVSQLDTAELQRQIEAQEQDFKSRLIELLGYPYAGEIGAGKMYPSGYTGPDLYHYLYIDNALGTVPASEMNTLTINFTGMQGSLHLFPNDVTGGDDTQDLGMFNVDGLATPISFPYIENSGYGFFAPADWGRRRAPGKIQLQLGETQSIQARINTLSAEHHALQGKVQDQIELIEDLHGIYANQIETFDSFISEFNTANAIAITARQMGEILEKSGESLYKVMSSVKEAPPKVVGFAAFDTTSFLRFSAEITAATTKASTSVAAAGVARAVQIPAQILAEQATFEARITIIKANYSSDIAKEMTELESLLRDELSLRYQMIEMNQELENTSGVLEQLLGEAARLMDERELFRRDIASRTLDERYQDMTYRIFRNDALQKYRAGFDQAARYTYLAAKAFDYETGLLSDDTTDQYFFENLVRQRSLGHFAGGTNPVAGVEGLSTPLANMKAAFNHVKSEYGFYTAQPEQLAFSLRNEAFRIGSVDDTQTVWQELLHSARVDDLRAIPECRRYCRIPDDELDEPIEGIVLRFGTLIKSGKNLFGWPLSPGDSAYDSSFAATKILSVGLHFENYPEQLLTATPRAYLIPVGTDVLRSPTATVLNRDPNSPVLRQYTVLDQSIPVPSDLSQTLSYQSSDWIPANDAVNESWDKVRRYSRMPVSYGSVFDLNNVYTNTRLIGRSVWNTEWMLIIPGTVLLANDAEGLNRLINGDSAIPEAAGITDIKLYFDTYSIPGQ
jgi:hypothetical protein